RYAKEYGFSTVEVESFPSRGALWQPSQGELWMVEPDTRKLYDIYDVAVSLAGNSESGDVTAEVVDVGTGDQADDYAGKDLKGKIVLGSTRPSSLQRRGVFEGGAVGVLSYNSIRPDSYPDQILSQSISTNAPEGTSAGFGWSIAPRIGREISAMLARGQKVVLRSIVKAETFPGELETVHATIPGDGSSDQAIAVSAHLYEGYIKQGANDDNSGCGLILEMGRAYLKLVKEGALPPPKRTIHFLWVPEISGTSAWLEKHEDIKKRMIADLNFDMEGLRLSTSASFWVLHRTPDTYPTYLNDVGQSMMEFIAELNRERVRFRSGGYGFTLPVVSPNGSLDPFYIKIDKHYGASDHVIYMQHGIPALMFITWPDMYYHSSQDVPDKLDPT
ncbi:MAG: M28 family peptidase, partial [Proteobacteria bacterium]|nr:M28 family peptidase [Pseudomonadota bacterium]